MSIVYYINNNVNGKIYIGSTCYGVNRRFNQHRSLLRRNLHPNRHLQHAWNLYGENSFSFGILEKVNLENRLKREQFWLDFAQAYQRDKGYNTARFAKSTRLGATLSLCARQKISQKLKGRTWQGKPLSEERKRHLSLCLKGRHFHTPESKAKISEAAKKPRSEAWKKSISASQKGKPRWSMPERERIRAQMTGKTQKLSTKLKRSATLKKLFSTTKYKIKRSKWMKRAWQTRKATAKITSKK